jgi:hypothetical protein
MGLPLVTKAEYKAYAGITSVNQDAVIDTLIPKISKLVKTVCRRTFVDYVGDAKTEYSEGGMPYITLSETPVISINSVNYSSDYGKTYTALVEFTDYVLNKRDNSLASLSTDGFAQGINAYEVSYNAGYETLPEDLKLAVFDLIGYYVKNDMAIHSPKAPGTNSVQIEYVTSTNLPAHIKRVLDQYTADYA